MSAKDRGLLYVLDGVEFDRMRSRTFELSHTGKVYNLCLEMDTGLPLVEVIKTLKHITSDLEELQEARLNTVF